MDPECVNAITAIVEAGAVVALVLITAGYALSTHGILKEMKKQQESARKALTEATRAALMHSYLTLYESIEGARIPTEWSADKVRKRFEKLLGDLEESLGRETS